jgi:hypothetical protein
MYRTKRIISAPNVPSESYNALLVSKNNIRASKKKNSLSTCIYQSDTVNPRLTSRVRTHSLSFFHHQPAFRTTKISIHPSSSIECLLSRDDIINCSINTDWRSHSPRPPHRKHAFLILVLLCFAKDMWLL